MKNNYKSKSHPASRIVSFAIALAVFIMYALPADAQNVLSSVRGKVMDTEGNPIAGATIVVEGAGKGTVSDNKGVFTLNSVNSDGVLIVSFMGYETRQVNVNNSADHTVVMEPDATLMDEVVVIGYGAVKKSDLTGSVGTVKMSDIKDAPVVSVDQALQGRIAGVDIMSTTGEPGATTSIRVRGTRSITAGNEPLIVVDGVMDAVHDLNDINSGDIASISILKDASSTAIYGTRGSNGVIIITTKQGAGSLQKPSITFKADLGFNQLPRKLDIMDASEFAQYRNDYAYFGGDSTNPDVGPETPLSVAPYPDPFSKGKGTDWIDEVSRTALYQNYALSLSGRTDKSSYYASFSFNETQGIIDKSGLERITGRINGSRQVFKWLKASYSGSYTWRHNDVNNASIGGTRWYEAAQYLSPLLAPNADFNPLWYSGQKINTPRHTIDMYTYYNEFNSTNNSFTVEIEPVKHLILKSQLSYYLYQRHTYRYYPGSMPKKPMEEGGDAWREEKDEFSLNSETTLTYSRNFDSGHYFDAMIGYSAYKLNNNQLSVSGSGYMDDIVKWDNMNAVLDKQTYDVSTTGFSPTNRESFFARANYNYKSRYYLTVTGRLDGSSNFAANRKRAFFPSAALKWNVANEEFMNGVNWIDELALRLSAGRTGNEAIPAYRSVAALSSTTEGYLFDGIQPAAFYRSRIGSPNLTWETTDSYNIALDLSFFRERLRITAEGYWTKTKDLLLNVQVASQTGYPSRFVNIGGTSNKGVEFTIESQNIVKPRFYWSTSLTVSHNSQMVDDIGGEKFVSALNAGGNNPYMMYGYVKGYPLNALWGFKYGGVWHNADEAARNKVTKTYISPTASTVTNGYARYYDINHDGTLSQDDLIYQGNADPYLYGGLQNTFHFHGFNLGVYFTYSLGGKIYNYAELWMAGSTFTNQYRYMLDSWHPVRNPESNLPRAGSVDTHVPSDLMIHDASFLRLKNVTLGYTFDLRKKIKWMRDITVSVSGENLWLWKKYNGFDPDVSSEGTSSTLRRVDLGAYPKPRTVIFSVQFTY